MIWLLRMVKAARHPPSPLRVRLGPGVVAVCLTLAAAEYIRGWLRLLTANERFACTRSVLPLSARGSGLRLFLQLHCFRL